VKIFFSNDYGTTIAMDEGCKEKWEVLVMKGQPEKRHT